MSDSESKKQSLHNTSTKLENVETRTYKLIKTVPSDEAMSHTQGSDWLCCFKDMQKQRPCLNLFFYHEGIVQHEYDPQSQTEKLACLFRSVEMSLQCILL